MPNDKTSRVPRKYLLATVGVRRLVVSVVLFSVFTNLLMLVGPLFMLQVYDRVLASGSEATLLALTTLVAVLYVFLGLIEFARGRVMSRVGAQFHAKFKNRFFHELIRGTALGQGGADYSRLSDLTQVRNFLSSPLVLAFFDLPWSPFFLAAIFFFHPWMGYYAIIGGAVLICVTLINNFATRKRTAEAASTTAHADAFSRMAEANASYVYAQGMAGNMLSRWSEIEDRSTQKHMSSNDIAGMFSNFSKSFRLFMQSGILALGAYLVLLGELSPGAMIAGSILLGRMLGPIDQILNQWASFQKSKGAYKRVGTFYQTLPDDKTVTKLPRPEGHLELANVSVLRASDAKPTLSNVSLIVEPGKVLGVVGGSGSGKSTLAQTIVGLTAPRSGEVRLGGARLTQYDDKDRGGYIGYLPQEPILFEGTIAQNIARMAPDPNPERVIAAAQQARVHSLITSLPEGYDTMLVPGKMRLSGGQKQRIALARALYSDPVLLVLDEPNSALDGEGVAALASAIHQMKSQEKSVVIMTHQPSAIPSCDHVLVLQAGEVVAHGEREQVTRSLTSGVSRLRATGASTDDDTNGTDKEERVQDG